MRIIIFISHPAKIHLFRNFYSELIEKGNNVLLAVVQKEITTKLLDIYNIPYIQIGKNKKNLLGKLIQLFYRELKLLFLAIKFRVDVLVGDESPEPAHVSFIIKKPYIAFADTEHAKLTWFLSKRFMNKILTPESFLMDLGVKHLKYKGYKEIAYLHPNYFIPDSQIFSLLNIRENEKFVFMRFISWNALHDRGQNGISDKIKIEAVREFSKTAKVFISAEGKLPEELEKYRIKIPLEKIHQVLYFASLYFGESGTMATESAILGTPTVRVSSLAKLLGNFKELNEKYKLVEYYDSDEMGLQRAKEILNDPNSKAIWRERAKKLLDDKIDVTKFMVNFVLDRSNYG